MTKIPKPGFASHCRFALHSSDMAWMLDYVHDNLGRVAEVGYAKPLKFVYLLGPEANQYILSDHPDTFSWSEAYELTEFLIGPTSLLVSDGEHHRRRRGLVQPAFSIRRIERQLDLVTTEIDNELSKWTPGVSLDAYREIRRTIRRVAVGALFGDSLGHRADELGQLLEPALKYLGRSPLQRRDIKMPWTAYSKSLKAKKAADTLIAEEINRRRAAGRATDGDFDTLSSLLAANGDGEKPLSDDEICDQIRGLIAAGYDSTSSAAAWLVHELGTNPEALAALRTQVLDTIGTRAPSMDDLRQLPLVDAVVKETLRLRPPASVGLRKAERDFEFDGYQIPAGSMVVYSPYITHRMADVWDNPTLFEPKRWEAGEPQPFSFVPFGGGYRRCIGFALATLELQVLAVRLAQNVRWTVQRPNPGAKGAANFAPKGGMPITILPRLPEDNGGRVGLEGETKAGQNE